MKMCLACITTHSEWTVSSTFYNTFCDEEARLRAGFFIIKTSSRLSWPQNYWCLFLPFSCWAHSLEISSSDPKPGGRRPRIVEHEPYTTVLRDKQRVAVVNTGCLKWIPPSWQGVAGALLKKRVSCQMQILCPYPQLQAGSKSSNSMRMKLFPVSAAWKRSLPIPERRKIWSLPNNFRTSLSCNDIIYGDSNTSSSGWPRRPGKHSKYWSERYNILLNCLNRCSTSSITLWRLTFTWRSYPKTTIPLEGQLLASFVFRYSQFLVSYMGHPG